MGTVFRSVSPIAAVIFLVFISISASIMLLVFYEEVLPGETEEGVAGQLGGSLRIEESSSRSWWVAPVNISNPHSSTLLDYSVRIVLNSSNYPLWNRSAPSDIYFAADPLGLFPLPYWIESFDQGSQTAVVWVRVDSLPPSTNTTIYMFVDDDNPYPDWRDPDRTFVFFDHFDGASLNTSFWDTSFAVDYEVRDSMLITRVGGIVLQNPLPFVFQDGYAAEARIMYVLDNRYYGGGLTVSSSISPAPSNNNADALVMMIRAHSSVNSAINYRIYGYAADGSVAGSYNVVSAFFVTVTVDYEWYTIGLGTNGTGTAIWLYEDGVFYNASVSWAKDIRWMNLGNFFAAQGGSNTNIQDTYYDWVRIRKWAYPEPQAHVGQWLRNTTVTLYLRNVGSSKLLVDQTYLREPGSSTVLSTLSLEGLELVPQQTVAVTLSFLSDYEGDQLVIEITSREGAVARSLLSPD